MSGPAASARQDRPANPSADHLYSEMSRRHAGMPRRSLLRERAYVGFFVAMMLLSAAAFLRLFMYHR